MELIHVKGDTWCLKGWEMIPLYRLDEHRCILLDSGSALDRKALREVLERERLIPVGAMASHAHEDHIGNHRWMQEVYGTKICMSEGEAATLTSMLHQKALFTGLSAHTLEDYLGDISVRSDQIIGPEDDVVDFMGVSFRIHHTPGHSADHICIGTQDGVCYVGDLLMEGTVLEAAQLPYHLVHSMARDSMKKMRNVAGYSHFIAAHCGVFEDIARMVDKNLERLDWICDNILNLMEEPVTWEQLMMQTLQRNHLYTSDEFKAVGYEYNMQNFVNDLKDAGKLSIHVEWGVRHYQRRYPDGEK